MLQRLIKKERPIRTTSSTLSNGSESLHFSFAIGKQLEDEWLGATGISTVWKSTSSCHSTSYICFSPHSVSFGNGAALFGHMEWSWVAGCVDNVKPLRDNARSNVAACVREKINKFCWEVLQHPQSRPSTVFHFLVPMKKFLVDHRPCWSAINYIWLCSNRVDFYVQVYWNWHHSRETLWLFRNVTKRCEFMRVLWYLLNCFF